MKVRRLGNNTTEQYSSFEELATAWKIKPVSKVTKDMKKLQEQQEKFRGRHLCNACKQPMEFIKDTSVMTCKNLNCKGIKQVRLDKEGNEIVSYLPSYDLLDELGTEIAGNIFS
jgi:hypothetical protein